MLTSADLAAAYERNVGVVAAQARGLTHADSIIQPPFRGNCFNWVVGHLVVHRDKALIALGSDPVFGPQATDRYQKESQPVVEDGDDVSKLEDLLAALHATQERLNAAFDIVTDEDLNAEVGSGAKTMPLYRRLHFLYFHDTYHTGQTELLRQLAGVDDTVI